MKTYNPEAEMSVAKRILEAGGQLFIVGGAIRDFIAFGRKPTEIDFVTNLHPLKIIELFLEDADVVGKVFGVVKVKGIDVASFRKDCYSADLIHTKGADSIEFASTIEEDLSRRDLTINAIAYKITTPEDVLFNWINNDNIVDPYEGIYHISKQLVKFVGNPYERITEDPCRMLRACRFRGLFPNGELSLGSYDAIRERVDLIDIVAKERIHLELMKTMKVDHPSLSLESLSLTGILTHIAPELQDTKFVMQNKYHVDDVFDHLILSMDAVSPKYPLLRMAALLHDIGKPVTKKLGDDGEFHFLCHETEGPKIAEKLLTRLCFSNSEIEYICSLIYNHMFFFEEVTKLSAYKRLMNRINYPVRDLLRLRMADRKGNRKKIGTPRAFKRVLRNIRTIEREEQAFKLTDLAINGHDLIALGVKPGPIFKEILENCLDIAIRLPYRNKKEILIKYIKLRYK